MLTVMALIVLSPVWAKPKGDDILAGIRDIPASLKKLQETTLEDERVQFNKTIHDAVVSADLSNKKVVRELDPMIVKIRGAMDAGLDRTNIAGQDTWLGSAVRYFYREKLRKFVEIAPSCWMKNQTESLSGLRLSIYPDKILLHKGPETTVLFQGERIHEAVMSPNGRTVAVFRESAPDSHQAEIWIVRVKNKKKKKILSWPSCQTLLLSEKGDRLFFQELPSTPTGESAYYSVSVRGGRPRKVGEGRLLETLVVKGPHRGALVVTKNVAHPLGIADVECQEAVMPSGHEVGRIRGELCR